MEQLYDTAREKADSHIVIHRSRTQIKGWDTNTRQRDPMHQQKLKAVSLVKGFISSMYTGSEMSSVVEDGLHLKDEGACVSIATHEHFWTKRSQPSSSGNGEGDPSPTGAPKTSNRNSPPSSPPSPPPPTPPSQHHHYDYPKIHTHNQTQSKCSQPMSNHCHQRTMS